MAQETQKMQLRSLDQKIPWGRAWQPTPVFLPRESHGQRSLAGYSPQGRKESDTTDVPEQAHTIMFHSNVLMVVTCLFMTTVKIHHMVSVELANFVICEIYFNKADQKPKH